MKIKEKNTKNTVNEQHLKLFEKSLESVEMILDGFLYDLRSYDESFLTLSKNSIGVLESAISSLLKIQKGERLALGMDEGELDEDIEPIISVIEGVDLKRV